MKKISGDEILKSFESMMTAQKDMNQQEKNAFMIGVLWQQNQEMGGI